MKTSKKKILIIDDDPLMRRLVHFRLVKHFGHNILEAEDGSKGVELAKSEGPDVILLDWKMPGMDGMEVISILKSHSNTRSIPIIMLTGKSLFGDMEDALSEGAMGYVVKPVGLDKLSRQINHALCVPA